MGFLFCFYFVEFFSGCCFVFPVCLFFFGTGTLALLGKQKRGYLPTYSVSYGAKDRNIVRKTVLFQHGVYLVLGCCADLGQLHTVVTNMISVQPFPRLSCRSQLVCSWIWCLSMYFKY